jgi:hypothetical protein
MKVFKTLLVLFSISMFVFTSCDKNENENEDVGSKVDLYLIGQFITTDNYGPIDEASVVTSKSPLINYADFISYNKSTYVFEISEHAIETIKNIDPTIDGSAFAIKVDDEIIYTGYFWPGYFSSICNWIVIDPLMLEEENELHVKLGYPETIEGVEIPDKRNDIRIIDVFKKDNKLIE